MNMKKNETVEESTPHAQSAVVQTADTDSSQNVGKIRDIIFGGQMREYDNRFTSIEERLNKESLRLRQDIEQRMNSLETLLQSEFEALTDKLRLEKKERNDSLLSIESTLKKANELLSQRLGDLENKSLDEMRKLRNQEHEDIKSLRSNLQQLREETNAQFEKELDILRKTKVDRSSVAALFAGGNF